jgi:hypothetical protein
MFVDGSLTKEFRRYFAFC